MPAAEPERPSRQADEPERSGSIDPKMLVIAAMAAVVAAVVTSMFWQKGTLISTALTPVIVTLVQEALRRPAEKISATAARVTPARGADALSAVARRPTRATPGGNRSGAPPLDDTRGPGAPPAGAVSGSRPPAARSRGPAPTVYRRKRFRPKLALLTALAAFAVAVAVLTLPEIVFGGSVAGDRGTTLFGGDTGAETSGEVEDTGGEEPSAPDEAAPDDGIEPQAAPGDEAEEPVAPEEETTEETAPLPEEEVPAPPAP